MPCLESCPVWSHTLSGVMPGLESCPVWSDALSEDACSGCPTDRRKARRRPALEGTLLEHSHNRQNRELASATARSLVLQAIQL